MSENRYDFCWKTHSYLNGYIFLADRKAALVVGLTGSLIAWLWFSAATSIDLANAPVKWAFWLAAIVLLGISFIAGFWAIWPFLDTYKVQQKKTGDSLKEPDQSKPTAGLIFWRNILTYANPNTFAKKISKTDDTELIEEVATHCHELAHTADRKYKKISFAFGSLALAIICLVVFSLIVEDSKASSGSESQLDANVALEPAD